MVLLASIYNRGLSLIASLLVIFMVLEQINCASFFRWS